MIWTLLALAPLPFIGFMLWELYKVVTEKDTFSQSLNNLLKKDTKP